MSENGWQALHKKELEQLRDKLKEIEAREAVLVEALQKIASVHTKLSSTALNNKSIQEVANEALTNASEQAKALLAVVEAAREMRMYCLGSDASTENMLHRYDSTIAAYDKLRGLNEPT